MPDFAHIELRWDEASGAARADLLSRGTVLTTSALVSGEDAGAGRLRTATV